MQKHVDVIILGQGLAGTTLAWKFLARNRSVMLLDRGEPTTASRIAAGLMTPITGKRFAKSWDWELFYAEAVQFYREIESKTGATFFEEVRMLRLFQSAEERIRFEAKRDKLTELVTSTCPDFLQSLRNDDEGGFEMMGGRLNVELYLDRSRETFQSIDSYRQCNVDVEHEIEIRSDSVAIPKLNLTGRRLIFCQGFQPAMHSSFDAVQFNPAKGEIIDVERNDIDLDCIVHRGIWLSPRGNQIRIGATYGWNDLSTETTETGRQWLTSQATDLLPGKYHLLQHRAAIRPTMHDFRPVLGLHPTLRNIGIFNGLGSKGSLMAPRLARMLVAYIEQQTPLPEAISIDRWS